MSSLENCLISTYLLWFSIRIQMEKNCGDTPSATLMGISLLKKNNFYDKWQLSSSQQLDVYKYDYVN